MEQNERGQADDLDDGWSEAYYERLEDEEASERLKTYGSTKKGYQWQSVFLPNGTQVRMTYQGKTYLADIRHQQLMFDGNALSPSEVARRIANNTNRNAWRDLWVKRPTDQEWLLADILRRQQ